MLFRIPFLFVDPYSVHDFNSRGHTYFEGFCKAIREGVKGMLWYGFDTIAQRDVLRAEFLKQADSNASILLNGIEMVSTLVSNASPQINPGVLGCGILIGNLSTASNRTFDKLSTELVNLYRGSLMFGRHPCDLYLEKFEIRI